MATLADLARQYLNQTLPDISGIFTLPQASNIITPTITTPNLVPVQGLTPEQLRLLYGEQSGGGSDEFRGGGAFGNLDLSKSKMFTKDVYDEELGDFIPTELEAFYNPTLGMYQTYEGKNINPMFSNTGMTPGIIGIAAQALGFVPKTIGGYAPGSIRGFYDTPIDLINRRKNIQTQTDQQRADIRRVQRDIDSGKYDGSGAEDNRNANEATKEAASKSSGVGVGGYTKQDSTRESYRGR
jgi:hypothetical protein